MPAAEAQVRTDRASRYLVQLCRHARQMASMRHRPPARLGGHTPPDVLDVDCSEPRGIVRFAEGQWTLEATADTLTLRVEAADAETLRRLQDGITARMEKIGRRDRLAVTWQQPSPDEQNPGAAPAPDTAAGKRRRRGWLSTIALAVGAALVVAVHLGVGGAALATSAWTGWAANIVLALILLKLVTIAGHLVLGYFALRGGKTLHARWNLRHPSAPERTVASSTTEQGTVQVTREDRS